MTKRAARKREIANDDEERALSRNPAFQALLQRSRESIARDGGMTLEELDAFLGLPPEEEMQGEVLFERHQRDDPDIAEPDTSAGTRKARNGKVAGTPKRARRTGPDAGVRAATASQ